MTDLALVLRRFRYGESSLVVHLLTPEHGRVSALAKGAYRLTSGYCGVLDLFDTLEVTWTPRTSELGLVRSASLVQRRRALSGDLARYRAGLGVLELAASVARSGPDARLFALVAQALDGLADGAAHPELVRLAHDLAQLEGAGLAPALSSCASCGARPAEVKGRAPFAVREGGRLCDACLAAARGAGRRVEDVPLQWIRYAELLSQVPLSRLSTVRMDEHTRQELVRFVEGFVAYHLEARPRSWGRSASSEPRRSPRRRSRSRS